MNPTLYKELTFSWKKDIANLVLQYNIPEELILNLEETSLSLLSPSIVTTALTTSHAVSTIYQDFLFFNGF